jgi:ABC-type transport system involved in multi-copper enzyme maturation permease subunit
VTGLIRSEILKIRTTNVWWIMLIAMAAFTGLALVVNCFSASNSLTQLQQQHQPAGPHLAGLASAVYTSGQLFGLLLAMIMGILIITNEFHHQTATPTFLTTPVRAKVIAGKLVAALVWGAVFAAVATVISVIAGAIFFTSEGYSTSLGDWGVIKAILLNLLAFGIWAVFGLGLGTLLRNQIGSVVVALVLYLVAQNLVVALLAFLSDHFHNDNFLKAYFYMPSGASQVMTQSVDLPHAPAWWIGAIVLAGYGIVAGLVGTAVTTRRDIA